MSTIIGNRKIGDFELNAHLNDEPLWRETDRCGREGDLSQQWNSI